MYLGEVINRKTGQRHEIQYKGAGKTPYSRAGDGRKVLRSSIREFLISEAMHALGVPTTRAATIITSDSRVERDIRYNGNPKMERCTVITRIAPTFLRFGSFEIFKAKDATTGRAGPSTGLELEMLPQMLDFTAECYFNDIWNANGGKAGQIRTWLDMFKEIVSRTSRLVAKWQSLGFAHGVLNTDNMSIIGLTIDYGPFGFLDRYDPHFICNASDDQGRYDFKSQPDICKWNCRKLAEAWSAVVPMEDMLKEIETFDVQYSCEYTHLMKRKLGLVNASDVNDDQLIKSLLSTMEKSAAGDARQ